MGLAPLIDLTSPRRVQLTSRQRGCRIGQVLADAVTNELLDTTFDAC
jgi:hypothetical protein